MDKVLAAKTREAKDYVRKVAAGGDGVGGADERSQQGGMGGGSSSRLGRSRAGSRGGDLDAAMADTTASFIKRNLGKWALCGPKGGPLQANCRLRTASSRRRPPPRRRRRLCGCIMSLPSHRLPPTPTPQHPPRLFDCTTAPSHPKTPAASCPAIAAQI